MWALALESALLLKLGLTRRIAHFTLLRDCSGFVTAHVVTKHLILGFEADRR